MDLKLKEVRDGKEIFTTDNPKVKEVVFEYVGTDDDLTRFLKVVILDYARKKKIID